MSQGTNQKKNQGAVSAAQFKRLQGRVRELEKWKKEIEEGKTAPSTSTAPGGTDPTDQSQDEMAKRLKELEDKKGRGWLSRFRGFVKRNPLFWTAGCLMAGYLLGCLICDFSTFGGY